MDLATREGDFMASTPTTNKDSLQVGQVLALPCRSLLDNPLRMTYYNQTHLAGSIIKRRL